MATMWRLTILALLVTGCGGTTSGEQVEGASYTGTCAPLNGAYLEHCDGVQGSNCGSCADLPDQVVDYNQANPGTNGQIQQGATPWTITSAMTSANHCVQNLTESDTSGDTGTLIREISADGMFSTVTFTFMSGAGLGICTVHETVTFQQ